MSLSLPGHHRRARVKFEIFPDFFQVPIVAGLVSSPFFFSPAQRMLPADALLHNLSISDAQSLLLLIAAMLRLQFARVSSTRTLLVRLALFLLVCAVATFLGDWIDRHHYLSAAAWFNLGWALPYADAGFFALTWSPSREPDSIPVPTHVFSFLSINLVLVAMLCAVSWMMNGWKQAYGEILADVAVAASLLPLTPRPAPPPFPHQPETPSPQA